MVLKVGIIGTGIGNLGSLQAALDRLSVGHGIVATPNDFESFSHIILMGVGNFGAVSRSLEERFELQRIRTFFQTSPTPLLGVCVGYQVLFEMSDEAPGSDGIGLFPGAVTRLGSQEIVPHVGWNNLEQVAQDCPLFSGIQEGSDFYFSHSYAPSGDSQMTAASVFYGGRFPVSSWSNNHYGVQFHPEKSQTHGMRLLRNFVEVC